MLVRGFGAVLSMFFRMRDLSTLLQVASLCGGAYYHFALHRSRLGNALKRLLVGQFRVANGHLPGRAVCTCVATSAAMFQRGPGKREALFKFDHGGA